MPLHPQMSRKHTFKIAQGAQEGKFGTENMFQLLCSQLPTLSAITATRTPTPLLPIQPPVMVLRDLGILQMGSTIGALSPQGSSEP